MPTGSLGLVRKGLAALPTGVELPDPVWRVRHRAITALVLVHVPALGIFALARGYGWSHTFFECGALAVVGVAATVPRLGRHVRSAIATFGLISASALSVHLSGGTIEAHFHFFVMLAVISLYQHWMPLLLALAYVLLHHGLIGYVSPTLVFNHAGAAAHPWRWALIHAGFVLAASLVNIITWRMNEVAQAETASTLALLSATLESTTDGILVVSEQGRITNWNVKFTQMWNIPDELMAGGDDEAALSFVLGQLKDPAEFREKVRYLYQHPTESSEDIIVFRDGRIFERYSQPQRLRGRPVGRVWSFRDVTERNRLDAMKDAFLSGVSHELRTPLTGVVGFASTLRRSDQMLRADDRVEMLARLEAAALKLQRLLDDTIDLDRLSRGILSPVRTETDIASLSRSVVDDLEVHDHKIVHTACDVAWIDAAKVERILENLVLNAVRHTPPGTTIQIGSRSTDEGLLLIVEDDGPGVPDDQKDEIFEAFERGSGHHHSPGFGIGLSLVSNFAQLHGGRAWVEDASGGGASFRVLLPAAGPYDREASQHISRQSA